MVTPITITCKQCCEKETYIPPIINRGRRRLCSKCLKSNRAQYRGFYQPKKCETCLVCGGLMLKRDPQVHRIRCQRIFNGWDPRVSPKEQEDMQKSFAYDEMSLIL